MYNSCTIFHNSHFKQSSHTVDNIRAAWQAAADVAHSPHSLDSWVYKSRSCPVARTPAPKTGWCTSHGTGARPAMSCIRLCVASAPWRCRRHGTPRSPTWFCPRALARTADSARTDWIGWPRTGSSREWRWTACACIRLPVQLLRPCWMNQS